MKLYIAILDEFPDYMTPTLVAHAVLNADSFYANMQGPSGENYRLWKEHSFKKCVVRVNQKEFDKISLLHDSLLQYEKHTLDGRMSCAIVPPVPDNEIPNVLKFAKLWKPK